MRYLYSGLFYLIFPFIFLRLWWKGRKNPAYRLRQKERLGFINPLKGKHIIWVHAVSLGEMIAARPLIQGLQKFYPEKEIIITNMTPTGSALASQIFGKTAHYAYVPYDTPDAVQRFLSRANPELAIIIETELWPNLLHYTAKRGIPILLANARLSEKSARGYARISGLIRPMLQAIRLIAVQTSVEAQRFISLGANPDRVVVTGSIKFDVPTPQNLVAAGHELRSSWGEKRPIVIAASTHAGEEEKVLRAFAEIRKNWPNALLVLVPRHADRFDEVALLCQKQGLSVIRRTEQLPCVAETQVFLGDTLGELFLFYAVADVAFVGGSFATVGGHNLLEPAALALPILTGPNLFNFTEIFALLNKAEAAICVVDEIELAKVCTELLGDEVRRKIMGERAQRVVEENRGALQKHLDCIEQLLPA